MGPDKQTDSHQATIRILTCGVDNRRNPLQQEEVTILELVSSNFETPLTVTTNYRQ